MMSKERKIVPTNNSDIEIDEVDIDEGIIIAKKNNKVIGFVYESDSGYNFETINNRITYTKLKEVLDKNKEYTFYYIN